MNTRRLAIIALLSIILLVFPSFIEIPHIVLYYIGIGLVMIFMTSTLYFFITMVMIIGMTQFVSNDLTPWQIVARLTTNQLLFLSALLVLFSVIIGVISWYENEKKFNQIRRNKS